MSTCASDETSFLNRTMNKMAVELFVVDIVKLRDIGLLKVVTGSLILGFQQGPGFKGCRGITDQVRWFCCTVQTNN